MLSLSGDIMVLGDAQSGATVRILGFLTQPGLAAKLRQLGLVPGDFAKVVRRAPFDGPFLIEISGREIALGKTIAEKVQVEAVL
jgi:Fe2+ transport system protein FeoA